MMRVMGWAAFGISNISGFSYKRCLSHVGRHLIFVDFPNLRKGKWGYGTGIIIPRTILYSYIVVILPHVEGKCYLIFYDFLEIQGSEA